MRVNVINCRDVQSATGDYFETKRGIAESGQSIDAIGFIR